MKFTAINQPKRRVSISSKSSTDNEPDPKARNKDKDKLEKIVVHLEYTCFICGNILGSATQTIHHIERIHGYTMPPRPVGRKRPRNDEFTYVKDNKGPYTIEEYACPSCWFHCPENDLEALNEHTREQHHPTKISQDKDGKKFSGKQSNEGSSRRSSVVSKKNQADDDDISSVTSKMSVKSNESCKEVVGKIDELINLFQAFFQTPSKKSKKKGGDRSAANP